MGDRTGQVHRVDRADPLSPAKRVPTATSVDALAVVEPDGVWLAAQRSSNSHRGGILRILDTVQLTHPTDPLGDPFAPITSLQGDGLVGLRRAGGVAGSTLLPNLASSIPVPTENGSTYGFNLRQGLVYSTGEPVRASDIRRAVERSFLVPSSFFDTVWGAALFGSIVGADACLPSEDGKPVGQCDLSSGIVVDDSAYTVVFKLTESDPDFLYKLATPYAHAIPESVPMDRLVEGPFPATGPYVVASVTGTETRMVRNERFAVWDATVRPDGFPDEIVFIGIACPFGDCSPEASDDAVAMVESGDADMAPLGLPARPSDDLLARLTLQYPDRWHFGSARTLWVVMNSSRPPFDNLDVRRAVNFALDRTSPSAQAVPTCQVLPPGWPGYEPYCPYTVSPDVGGSWHGPDTERARELIAASGTSGLQVGVGPTLPFHAGNLDRVASVLSDLGYGVDVDRNTDADYVVNSWGTAQVSPNGWSADFLSPANFLGLFKCHAEDTIDYCDPTGEFDAGFDRALQLQATDRAAANAAWAELDQWVVDQAIVAPISNPGAYFVSDRFGNYQFSPAGVPLYDQMWVQ
jgi:peptide/nickel transport system substrate-binding protein